MDLMPFLFRILEAFPDTEVVQQKTQISLKWNGHPYAALYEAAKTQAGLSFFSDEAVSSPRIRHCVEAYPGRFTHHMRLSAPDEIDGEMLEWLKMARVWPRGRRTTKLHAHQTESH